MQKFIYTSKGHMQQMALWQEIASFYCCACWQQVHIEGDIPHLLCTLQPANAWISYRQDAVDFVERHRQQLSRFLLPRVLSMLSAWAWQQKEFRVEQAADLEVFVTWLPLRWISEPACLCS